MKREDLKAIGLTDEQIAVVMKANGADIENAKSGYADYEVLKAKLGEDAQKLQALDNVRAESTALKAELDKVKTEAASKIAGLERMSKVGEFTRGKKFVNEITRKAIEDSLAAALTDTANEGKSMDDIFQSITKDKGDILIKEAQPAPPVMAGTKEPVDDKAAINQARAIMGLPPK